MDYCKLFCMIWLFLFSAVLCVLAFMEAWNPHSSHVSSHYVIYLMPVPSSYFSSVITSLWNPSLTFYVLFNYLMCYSTYLLHYGTYHRFNLIDCFPIDCKPPKGRDCFCSQVHPPCLANNRYLIICRTNKQKPKHNRYLENSSYHCKILLSKEA